MPTWLFRELSRFASYLVVALLAVATWVFVKQLAKPAVVLLIFALGLWAGWNKEAISTRLWPRNGDVKRKTSPHSTAGDFAQYPMKLRERALPKVEPRKPDDLTSGERAVVGPRKSTDLTAEEQGLLDKGETTAVYAPSEHSGHSIIYAFKTGDGENAKPMLLFVFGMEDAEPARKEGETMAEFYYSRSLAEQFLFAEGWDKYHDRFFTRCYIEEGENAYTKAQSAAGRYLISTPSSNRMR
jgi:hypothetical protein